MSACYHQSAASMARQSSFASSSSCCRRDEHRSSASLKISSKATPRRRRRQKGDNNATTVVTTNALVPGPDDQKVQRNPRPEYIPGKIQDPSYVRVFDTTLRDGEQSPGATLTSTEKVQIATNLAKLGVDIIEAGFPIASPDDLEAVRNIAKSRREQSVRGRVRSRDLRVVESEREGHRVRVGRGEARGEAEDSHVYRDVADSHGV